MTHYILETLMRATKSLTLRDVYEEVAPRVIEYLRGGENEGKQTPVFSDQTPSPPALIRP